MFCRMNEKRNRNDFVHCFKKVNIRVLLLLTVIGYNSGNLFCTFFLLIVVFFSVSLVVGTEYIYIYICIVKKYFVYVNIFV